jgi:hypothetical protein
MIQINDPAQTQTFQVIEIRQILPHAWQLTGYNLST